MYSNGFSQEFCMHSQPTVVDSTQIWISVGLKLRYLIKWHIPRTSTPGYQKFKLWNISKAMQNMKDNMLNCIKNINLIENTVKNIPEKLYKVYIIYWWEIETLNNFFIIALYHSLSSVIWLSYPLTRRVLDDIVMCGFNFFKQIIGSLKTYFFK